MQTIIKIVQIFPNDVNNFSDGKLPIHIACEVATHVSILDTLWKKSKCHKSYIQDY